MDTVKATESNIEVTQQTVTSTNEGYLRYMGGRKFSLSLVSITFTTVLCWFGKIDPSVFSFVVVATITAYTAGNVIQKIN